MPIDKGFKRLYIITMTTENNSNDTKKKVTLRDRKKAQPNAIIFFSDAEKKTIRDIVAKGLNDSQFKIFLYTSQALGLNPLVNEICAVTYKDRDGGSTMSIQVMRDGFLTIAHRSHKFAGLESGVTVDDTGKVVNGWAKVYHKDFDVPVYQEADFEEYNTGRNLWTSKPKTMIKKVAESMALRKAFNVNGVYAPEEMEKEIQTDAVAPKLLEIDGGDKPITEQQIKTIQAINPDIKEEELKSMTKQQGAEKIQELTVKK